MRKMVLMRSWHLCSFLFLSIVASAQVTEEWVARYNNSGNLEDEAADIAVDAAGNVYVTGSSAGVGTSRDYATVKYNSAGVQLWVARYNGTGNSFDDARKIAIDANGNVYVTGSSAGAGTEDDYATIKYNSMGVLQWVSRYNGPGNSIDAAQSLAVDADGNVYVTGSSFGAGANADYATIKYNSEGAEQWVARYNGPANGTDRAGSLTLGNDGSVYVTGSSTGIGTNLDYATIKYNAAGSVLWVSRYNGAGNDRDVANSVTADNEGDVYVTGTIISGFDASGDPFPFELLDWATIKYNSVGAVQWVSIHDEGGDDFAVSVKLDNTGNVIVTGSISNSPPRLEEPDLDYGTIKYNASTGAEIWVAKYGPPPGEDFNEWSATDQAIDSDGNVYVTGQTGEQEYGTVKFSSNGVLQWAVAYKNGINQAAFGIAVDASGNVYVTGRSDPEGCIGCYDYATVKYNQVQTACGKNGDKILVCHKGKKTLCINSSDVAEHFGHGDELGACATTIASAANARMEELVAGIDEIPARFRVSVIPNPAITTARILYELPADGRVSIQLFDVLGREIKTVVDAGKQAGFHNEEFNVSALPQGMYYYRIMVKTAKAVWSQTGKIIH
ncbi:SBBP repeat-containing protein [Niastella populi]|nr:SBBP repeat-containing protein [Niastella populi]